MNHNKKPWKPVYIPPDPKEWHYYDMTDEIELREDLTCVLTLTFSCGEADYFLHHEQLTTQPTPLVTGWGLYNYRTGALIAEYATDEQFLNAVFVPQCIPFLQAFRAGLVRFFEDYDMGEKYGWEYRPVD